MEPPTSLDIHPVPHPSLEVHRAGFPLEHPYVEQCWTPILGPSSVLLLRRAAYLWRAQTPAQVDPQELAAQLGLGHRGGQRSPFARTIQRVVRFRFAEWSDPTSLAVYSEVRPLRERELERVPEWCARQHEVLLTRHLDELQAPAAAKPGTVERSPDPPDPAAEMVTRLSQFASSQRAEPAPGLGR